MKKGSSLAGIVGKAIVGIIVLALFAPWIIPSFAHSPFAGPKETIFIRDDDNGEHYIAQFKTTHQLCIYHYIDETEEMPTIAGVKTVYRCEGAFYNPLIGPVHTHPKPGILLWKNFAVFAEGEKQRAAVKIKSEENYVAYATDEAAVTGTFYDDISIGENYIILSGQKFMTAKGEDKIFAERVIEWFDSYAQEV